MKVNLISILKKEYQIHTILNKLQSSLQLELRQLQTFSKIMSELKSEISKLKSILSQKKKDQSIQNEQNKNFNSRKHEFRLFQNKKDSEKSNDSEEKNSSEKKLKTDRSYLLTKEF